jgi:hypothetical protein
MKMSNQIICSSIAVAAALALSASTAQAQNLLVNGSFETSPGGWTANPITLGGVNQGWAPFDGRAYQSDMFYSVDYPQDGSYALLEQNAPDVNWNPAGAYQIVSDPSITAGAVATLSAWFLTDTGTTSPIGPVDIQLQFFDSALVNLTTFETGWIYPTANDTWTQATVMGTAPAGTAFASVYLMFMDNGQTATENMYFDNVVLTVPEPSTLALLGLAIPFFFLRRKSV